MSADRVDVTYVLDGAEIPTFQKSVELAKVQAEVAKRLTLTVDGRTVALRPASEPTLTHPPGQGGLKTTRVVLPLDADRQRPAQRQARGRDLPRPRRLEGDRRPPRRGHRDALERARDRPDERPAHYPKDLLKSPEDMRTATFDVRPGNGTLDAPGAKSRHRRRRHATASRTSSTTATACCSCCSSRPSAGARSTRSPPATARRWSPPTSSGTQGKPRDAVALGGIVTATHTAGVFALGLITLALSQYVLPEDLFPWLNLVSGLLVVGVGASVLRRQLKKRQHAPSPPPSPPSPRQARACSRWAPPPA